MLVFAPLGVCPSGQQIVGRLFLEVSKPVLRSTFRSETNACSRAHSAKLMLSFSRLDITLDGASARFVTAHLLCVLCHSLRRHSLAGNALSSRCSSAFSLLTSMIFMKWLPALGLAGLRRSIGDGSYLRPFLGFSEDGTLLATTRASIWTSTALASELCRLIVPAYRSFA